MSWNPLGFSRILHAVEGGDPLLRMGAWLGDFGLFIFGSWLLFGCLVVIGCRMISLGAWLNAFSRMSAPRVPYAAAIRPPRAACVRPPRAMHRDVNPVFRCQRTLRDVGFWYLFFSGW